MPADQGRAAGLALGVALAQLHGIGPPAGAAAGATFGATTGAKIRRWDGARWNSLASQTTSDLRAIWGSGPFNIYAVGDNGTVLHYLP